MLSRTFGAKTKITYNVNNVPGIIENNLFCFEAVISQISKCKLNYHMFFIRYVNFFIKLHCARQSLLMKTVVSRSWTSAINKTITLRVQNSFKGWENCFLIWLEVCVLSMIMGTYACHYWQSSAMKKWTKKLLLFE